MKSSIRKMLFTPFAAGGKAFGPRSQRAWSRRARLMLRHTWLLSTGVILLLGGLPLATALFFDSGIVTQSFATFDLEEIRYSVGMAFLRLVVPGLGAFSVEYAVPLNPRLGDDPLGRFHINLGFVF